jgi:HD-GYP domain-containing protein (c-di-GMP phosphodiesterase class II)
MNKLKLFSMLHDIGKIGIDDRILKKPGPLTEDEWKIMRTHPQIGYRIAMASSEFKEIAPYIVAHHERWDGKGYPRGLRGEEIPLLARILAVADAYDAMTTKRVYKDAGRKEVAFEELKRNAGTQFDPKIINIFLSLVEAGNFGCTDV